MNKDVIFYSSMRSGMSYSSIFIAQSIAKELSNRLGGVPEDYFDPKECALGEEIFVCAKPKKFIWQTMQYPRCFVLKQLEKK